MAAKTLKAPYPNLPYRAPNEESTNHLKPALPQSAKVVLSPDELRVLCDIAERVLRHRLENLEHSYRICRLCCYEGCTNCPIDAELHERGVDRENSGEA